MMRTERRANPFSPLKSAHAQTVERWLGKEKIAKLQQDMKGWYGRPICLLDVPGSLWITKDGDFVGYVNGGYFASAMDWLEERARRLWIEMGRPSTQLNSGFASISDALARASSGNSQRLSFSKTGASGTVNVTNTLWRLGSQPAAGAVGAAAPGGTAHARTDTGALPIVNPASGTLHLVGADASSSGANLTLLLYDRLFSVAKTMNSTATEAVTGVPTRYQSTTDTAEDYIGDNFGFIETTTTLAATAHNWTTCLYTDQANSSSTLPSVTGVSAQAADRLDQPGSTWFTSLAAGDVGIKAWTQMQCSAAVATGAINFCIGHPIGFMSFPQLNVFFPFDWLTNRDQAPRVFADACLAFLEPVKASTAAATYNGRVYLTSAAP